MAPVVVEENSAVSCSEPDCTHLACRQRESPNRYQAQVARKFHKSLHTRKPLVQVHENIVLLTGRFHNASPKDHGTIPALAKDLLIKYLQKKQSLAESPPLPDLTGLTGPFEAESDTDNQLHDSSEPQELASFSSDGNDVAIGLSESAPELSIHGSSVSYPASEVSEGSVKSSTVAERRGRGGYRRQQNLESSTKALVSADNRSEPGDESDQLHQVIAGNGDIAFEIEVSSVSLPMRTDLECTGSSKIAASEEPDESSFVAPKRGRQRKRKQAPASSPVKADPKKVESLRTTSVPSKCELCSLTFASPTITAYVRHSKRFHWDRDVNGLLCQFCDGRTLSHFHNLFEATRHYDEHEKQLRDRGTMFLLGYGVERNQNQVKHDAESSNELSPQVSINVEPTGEVMEAVETVFLSTDACAFASTEPVSSPTLKVPLEDPFSMLVDDQNEPEIIVDIKPFAPSGPPEPVTPAPVARRFRCRTIQCKRFFSSKANLERHQWKHRIRQSRCSMCRSLFFYSLKSGGFAKLHCAQCSPVIKAQKKAAAKAEAYRVQCLSSCTKSNCFFCPSIGFNTKNDLIAHLATDHPGPLDPPKQCPHCPDVIDNAVGYYFHFRAHDYDRDRQIECTDPSGTCRQRFKSQEELAEHLQTHHRPPEPEPQVVGRQIIDGPRRRKRLKPIVKY